MRFALAAVEVDGDSVQLRRFAVVVVNRLLLVNRAVLVAPGQRFAAHAQHVVVRERDIAIEVVADDAISTDLTIGIVAVSIKRVLAVVARFDKIQYTQEDKQNKNTPVSLCLPPSFLITHIGR